MKEKLKDANMQPIGLENTIGSWLIVPNNLSLWTLFYDLPPSIITR